MRPESSSCRAQNSKKKDPPAVFANTAYLRRSTTHKLNKPTNQRQRRRVRRRSGRSPSAAAEGEEEALRPEEREKRFGRWSSPAPIDLSITRALSLAPVASRQYTVPLALSH